MHTKQRSSRCPHRTTSSTDQHYRAEIRGQPEPKILLAAIRYEEGFNNLLKPPMGGSPRCARAPTPKSWSDCCRNAACSKRREGKLPYTNVRSHSFITWGHSVRRRFALCGSSETLPQSRKGLGYHHKIVRNASIVVETSLARIPDSALIVIPTPERESRKKTTLDWQT